MLYFSLLHGLSLPLCGFHPRNLNNAFTLWLKISWFFLLPIFFCSPVKSVWNTFRIPTAIMKYCLKYLAILRTFLAGLQLARVILFNFDTLFDLLETLNCVIFSWLTCLSYKRVNRLVSIVGLVLVGSIYAFHTSMSWSCLHFLVKFNYLLSWSPIYLILLFRSYFWSEYYTALKF